MILQYHVVFPLNTKTPSCSKHQLAGCSPVKTFGYPNCLAFGYPSVAGGSSPVLKRTVRRSKHLDIRTVQPLVPGKKIPSSSKHQPTDRPLSIGGPSAAQNVWTSELSSPWYPVQRPRAISNISMRTVLGPQQDRPPISRVATRYKRLDIGTR